MIVWTFWENPAGVSRRPGYLDLCERTLRIHTKNCDLRVLNYKKLHRYLPGLRTDIKSLPIPQQTDYIRVALLEQYGGMWVDFDTIWMKDPSPLFAIEADFVGFGCSAGKGVTGYPRPSNGCMISKKGGIFITAVKKRLDEILNGVAKESRPNLGYFTLGREVLHERMDYLQKTQGYDYVHMGAEIDGTRDINGNWVHTPNHVSLKPTELLDKSKLFFVWLANRELQDHFVGKLSADTILRSHFWLSRLFRKALASV